MTTLTPVLSPRELGRAIGVSESSVKRWIDRGTIPAARTRGGHRRIEMADAIDFIRRQGATLVSPEILGLEELSGLELASNEADREEQAYQALIEGRELEFRGQLMSLYLSGESVARICDGPVRRALERIGDLYHDDPEGILIEHRATDICLQAVSQLRLLIVQRNPIAKAIGCAPSGDIYVLPSLMVASVLKELGCATTNLGADTPMEVLHAACEAQKPDLVWLSVSVAKDRRQLSNEIRDLAARLEVEGSMVLLGGRNSRKLDIRGASNIFHAHSLNEVTALVQGLLADRVELRLPR